MIADNQIGHHGYHPSQSREEVWIGDYGYAEGVNVISLTKSVSREFGPEMEEPGEPEYDSYFNFFHIDNTGAHNPDDIKISSSRFDFELDVILDD